MNIHPFIFFDLIGITAVLSIGLVVVLGRLGKTLDELHRHKGPSAGLTPVLLQEEIEKTAEAALGKIEEMQKKSLEVIQETQKALEESRKEIDSAREAVLKNQVRALEKTASDFMTSYREALMQVEEHNLDGLKEIIAEITKITTAHIGDFKEVLQQETIAAQKIVEERIEEEYKTMQEEVSAYKTLQLKRVDDSMYRILHAVSKEVFQKILPVEEHEQLVIEALKEARKEELRMKDLLSQLGTEDVQKGDTK